MRLDRKILEEKIQNTFIDLLGIIFIDTDAEDSLEAIMEVKENFSQTMGLLHGGAIISLADTVAGVASNVLCAEDEKCLGMQISANLISSAYIGDVVRGKGVVIHKGRSTHVWCVTITSETSGKVIATVNVTNAVMKAKK